MLESVYAALTGRDIATALTLAHQALAAEPDSVDALKALSLALRESGETAESLACIERAIALAPHRADLYLARAGLALSRGDAEAVDAALGEAVAVDPNTLGAYLMGIHHALGQNRVDEAERQLKLAQRVAPEHPHTLAAEGMLALARGDHDAAIRLLSAALKRLPEDRLILATLGLAYHAAGNHAFAEGALRRAVEGQPRGAGLRWALLDCLRKQDRLQEGGEVIEEILAEQPDNLIALGMAGDLAMRLGQRDKAGEAYRRLIARLPYDQAGLDRMLTRLGQAGMEAEAVALIETALQRFPEQPLLWQRRLIACGGDSAQTRAVLERWQTAQPGSVDALLFQAGFDEWEGRFDEAETAAREVLSQRPQAMAAEQILLRADLRRDPVAGERRIQRLLDSGQAEDLRAGLISWRALAHDAQGRHAQAAQDWALAWQLAPPRLDLTEPSDLAVPPLDAEQHDFPAILLWSPPGGRPREALAMLTGVPGLQFLNDRFGPSPRPDGFGPPRPDGSFASPAERQRMVQQIGADPQRAIDWLPHWDARIGSALPGATLVAVIDDPRDLLLGWLAFGSAWPVQYPGAEAAAQWLLKALAPLAQRQEDGDAKLVLVRGEALQDAPEQVAEQLRSALNLTALPNAARVIPTRKGLGGLPAVFPPGHWRHYRDALAPAFALLQPLALRLGYPAD